jgi:hypothetical protein
VSACTLTGRSFRVQFRADADIRHGACSGRVEHIRSGDAAHFSSAEELLSFLALWLARDVLAKPARADRRT